MSYLNYPRLADEEARKLRKTRSRERIRWEASAGELREQVASLIPAYEQSIARAKKQERKENRRRRGSSSWVTLDVGEDKNKLQELREWAAVLRIIPSDSRFPLDYEDARFFNLPGLPAQLHEPEREVFVSWSLDPPEPLKLWQRIPMLARRLHRRLVRKGGR